MRRREAFKRMRQEDVEFEKQQGNDKGGKDTHYSQKSSHRERSIANNPKKERTEMSKNDNTGNWNTGDWNSGNRNSGNRNSGDWNSGDRNTGHWNNGNWNTGDWNNGNWNTGDRNTGNWNTGDCNTGDCNSGDCNSGNMNSGSFNTNEPKMRLFNKELDMTVSEFYNKYSLYMDIPLNRWINKEDMTDKEKSKVEGWETMGGYLKTLDFKEVCKIWWAENEDEHERFLTLPGFDKDIFLEITGIDTEEKVEELTLEEVCKQLGKTIKIVK